jgi:hypothetical protein
LTHAHAAADRIASAVASVPHLLVHKFNEDAVPVAIIAFSDGADFRAADRVGVSLVGEVSDTEIDKFVADILDGTAAREAKLFVK